MPDAFNELLLIKELLIEIEKLKKELSEINDKLIKMQEEIDFLY